MRTVASVAACAEARALACPKTAVPHIRATEPQAAVQFDRAEATSRVACVNGEVRGQLQRIAATLDQPNFGVESVRLTNWTTTVSNSDMSGQLALSSSSFYVDEPQTFTVTSNVQLTKPVVPQ